MFIRTKRNSSGHTAIQVVKKVGRRNRMVKHIGTARSPLELSQLKERAQSYIDQKRINAGVISLFDSRFTQSELDTLLERLRFTHAFDTVTYRFFHFFCRRMGLSGMVDPCFTDLVVARIVEPASKRRTRDILEMRFGKRYSLPTLYRTLRAASRSDYRSRIERHIHTFVTVSMKETLTVIFFDVTTLYFETGEEDDIRKHGFSKDGKPQQPQIVVALAVTASGMPILTRMFEGNTFEGHTMLPCVRDVRETCKSSDLIVVADSAMMSADNMQRLEEQNLRYIVGARLANMSTRLLETITTTIPRTDRAHIRLPFGERDRILIVSYSVKRAAKDKSDREKQIRRAQEVLERPGHATRRYKFLSVRGAAYALNQELIRKMERLEGLKGYVTNARALSDEAVIEKYASLWQVERSFRMSKSDLQARPIFHTLKESIEVHLLIVFAALAVSRYVEIATGTTIQSVIAILTQVKEIIVEDPSTGQTASKFTNLTEEAQRLLRNTDGWVT
jgi:transposase